MKNRNRKNYCWPHKGNFDDYDNPLDEKFNPYMPGARTCNHSDCVFPDHVIPAIEMEWWDISYRTGQKLTHQETYKKIVSEAW